MLVGSLAAGGSQANDAVRAHFHVAVALKPLEGHGDCRRGDLKPVGQRGRNHLVALGLGLQDGLEVVLFRNVDGVFHC